MLCQGLARQIAADGSALVKVDGPYGGWSSLTAGISEVTVIFAGGIGVCTRLGSILTGTLCR